MRPMRNKHLGLSLVELLVAMALGLILTAGALQMMLASQNLYRTTDSLSRIQESGRFAINFLAKDIRMAGYKTGDRKSFYTDDCDTFSPCTNDGGGNSTDRIGVMLTPSQPFDCLGNAINSDPDDSDIVNVYYLQTANGISSLYCRGFDSDTGLWTGTGQPLVDGVENMQILYGVKAEIEDKDIEQYLPASSADIDFDKVATVRIALLINNGQSTGNGERTVRNFTLLDAPQQSFNDKHERQIYTATIAVNNAIYPTK